MVASVRHNLSIEQKLRQCLGSLSKGFVVFTALTAITVPAFAQSATCDPQYWESMKSRAWAEAQREITQNQNIIYKADSVLEYSCFDNFLEALATVVHTQHALFSETQQWGSVSTSTNMVNALNTLVANSLPNYIGSNFGHKYLGDRSTEDYTVGTAGGGTATYSCDVMAKVWQAAKCINFIDRASIDDFFYLSKYDGWDPRELPSGYACTADTRWAAELSKAKNDANQYPKETFNMYTNFYDTASCNAPAIPTGVTVTRSGMAAYQEHICANPGCAFDKSGSCKASP